MDASGGEASKPEARVVLGRVVGAHGLGGQLRVRFLGDGPDHLLRARKLALARAADDPSADWFEVACAAAGRKGEVRLTLTGITSREDAEAMKGRLALGDPGQLEPLPPGQFYWYQLVGCRVEGADGHPIGTVRELWETGAHDVLVVENEDGQRTLLPTARRFLRRVDLEGRRIVIDVIPGLLDPD